MILSCLYLLLDFEWFLTKHSLISNIRGRRGYDRIYGSWIYNYICNQCLSPPVPDLPLCLGVLKHRAPLARGGGGIFQPSIFFADPV
jgi:hypothetical protein